MLQELLTFDAILLGLGALVAMGVWLYRTFSKQSPELKRQRLLLVQDIAFGAWHAVDSVATGTATTIDDKIAAALKKISEALAAQTGKPLTPGEAAIAKVRLEGIAGAQAKTQAALSQPTPR
jgi:hypothetical protein